MKNIIFIIIIIFITIIYFLTLSPGIGFGDSGTMAAAAVSLGIPHPPGFPTYILLGHLFSRLPWGAILLRLQLLSLLPAIGTVLLTFVIAYKNNKLWPALLTALLTAFFYGFWSQAGNVESYMITNFFIFGLIWLGLSGAPAGIMGLLLGLGAGLNPIGVAVVPVLLYLFKLSKKTLVIFLIAGLTAILVYAYLPIRALAHPFLNWGNPQTALSFFKYVTGGGLNINSGTVVNGFTGSIWWLVDAWGRFLYLALTQLTPLVMALSLFGAWQLWQKERSRFWVWIIILLTNVSLAGIYISGNRDIWLVTSLVILIILAGEGLIRLGKTGWVVGIITLAIIIWISAPKILGRAKTDIAGQYLTDIYQNLPKNSILIGGGETFNALTLYAHEVAKIRPDVTPVDMTIFYGQEWYRDNIKYQRSNIKITDQNAKFSDDLEFSRVLEEVADLNPDQPVFVTGYLLTQPVYANSLRPAYVPQKYQLEQHGLVYRLVKTAPSLIPPPPPNPPNFPSYLESNYQKAIDLIRLEYSLAYEIRGDRFLEEGKTEEAFSWYKRASEASPKYFDQNRLGKKVIKPL